MNEIFLKQIRSNKIGRRRITERRIFHHKQNPNRTIVKNQRREINN